MDTKENDTILNPYEFLEKRYGRLWRFNLVLEEVMPLAMECYAEYLYRKKILCQDVSVWEPPVPHLSGLIVPERDYTANRSAKELAKTLSESAEILQQLIKENQPQPIPDKTGAEKIKNIKEEVEGLGYSLSKVDKYFNRVEEHLKKLNIISKSESERLRSEKVAMQGRKREEVILPPLSDAAKKEYIKKNFETSTSYSDLTRLVKLERQVLTLEAKVQSIDKSGAIAIETLSKQLKELTGEVLDIIDPTRKS